MQDRIRLREILNSAYTALSFSRTNELSSIRQNAEKWQLMILWERMHGPTSMRNLFLLIVFAMAGLCVFDFFLFSDSLAYIQTRVLLIAGLSLFLIPFFLAMTSTVKHPRLITQLAMTSMLVSVTWVYLYFLSVAKPDETTTVLLGTFLVVMFSNMVSLRFSWVNNTYTLLNAMITIVIMNMVPTLKKEYILVLITEIVAWGVGIWLREEYRKSLVQRYVILRNTMSTKEAKIVAVASEASDWMRSFEPANKFSVCISVDWRNSQQITKQIEISRLNQELQLYYESIFAELDNICDTDSYHASWVADELFVIFNAESTDRSLRFAIEFTKRLAGPLYFELRSKMSFELFYDVGIACGVGLIGLMGPRGAKRTTVLAEHAGIAKRLQTHAKFLRKKCGKSANGEPICVLDEKVGHAFQAIYPETMDLFAWIEARVRDVSNTRFAMFTLNKMALEKAVGEKKEEPTPINSASK